TDNVRGSLAIDAGAIDLDGILIMNNVRSLTLRAAGDIRLFGAGVQDNYEVSPGVAVPYTRYTGALLTAGDATFAAGQVYPGTGQEFTIRSFGVDSTIRFEQTGARPAVPLSAGGKLQITAARIVQGGTVRAPQGSITFGVAGTTQSVDFLAGSFTSVSLE